MPQSRSLGRASGRTEHTGATLAGARFVPVFGVLVSVVLGAALFGLDASPARAADDGSDQASVWSKFMQTLGMKKPVDADSNINYTERSPLVVPPTRDLPPPEAALPRAADWPVDPNVKRHRQAKAKAPDPSAPPVQVNPNPPYQKKPWYNPAGWFSKEEYAQFTGEPSRADLTDPPAGYLTPSTTQPYGIGPDKKGTVTSAADRKLTPIMGGSTPSQ